MKVGSMFSGVGGLDMAVHHLFPDAEPAWFFEWEDAPSAVLAERFPDVPNHRDVTTWAEQGLEPVDILVGGFPCQDISQAGKQAGIKEGTRSGLWYRMADAIGALRPGLVLLENVSAILANGGPAVVGSLAALGYDARWVTVRASDVGACHRRERWFCVAYPHDAGRGEQWRAEPVRPEQPAVERSGADAGLTLLPTPGASDGTSGPDLARANRPGSGGMDLVTTCERLLPTPTAATGGDGQREDGYRRLLAPEMKRLTQLLPTPTSQAAKHGATPDVHADGYGHNLWDVPHLIAEMEGRWGDYAAAIARWEHVLGRPAPAPTDDKGRLAPAFTEWMMGWPDGWTEPAGSRSNRLKACGNGVVPQQAAAAFAHLLH